MKYRAYKYRLYPNEEQKVLIAKHLGSCRFIYNYALDKKVRAYQTDKTNLSRFDIQADLPNMKKSEEYCWLKEVNSLSLQASLANLDSAYTKFLENTKVSQDSSLRKIASKVSLYLKTQGSILKMVAYSFQSSRVVSRLSFIVHLKA